MRHDVKHKGKRNVRTNKGGRRMRKSVGKSVNKKRRHRSSGQKGNRPIKQATSPKKKKRWVSLFVRETSLFIRVISVMLILLISLSGTFYSVKRVSGYGMLPNLGNKDLLVVQRYSSIGRFDLVWVANGNEAGFRRVIGLPGEQLVFENDRLWVNNEEMDEKYLVDKINEYQAKSKNYTTDFSLSERGKEPKIPEDYYFVLGDNRPYTTDSREYGLVAKETIKGKVVLRLLPLEQARYF